MALGQPFEDRARPGRGSSAIGGGRRLADVLALVGQAAEVDLEGAHVGHRGQGQRSPRNGSPPSRPRGSARGSPRDRPAHQGGDRRLADRRAPGRRAGPGAAGRRRRAVPILPRAAAAARADGRADGLDNDRDAASATAGFALNRPSAAITRGWRSAFRPPCSSSSTRAGVATSVPIVSTLASAASRTGSGVSGRGPPRSGRAARALSSIVPKACARSRGGRRDRAPRANRCRSAGSDSRSPVSITAATAAGRTGQAGRPGGRGPRRGRAASPPSRPSWPAACPGSAGCPTTCRPRGGVLRCPCAR